MKELEAGICKLTHEMLASSRLKVGRSTLLLRSGVHTRGKLRTETRTKESKGLAATTRKHQQLPGRQMQVAINETSPAKQP